MPSTISQRQLRNDNAEVIRRVETGESFTVTKRGNPVADLLPHQENSGDPGARFLPVDQLIARMSDLPPWGAAAFDREQRELDGLVDDEQDEQRDPWT